MTRFLMLLAVAAVAGAMYVAAAPGSQQASGPTARQFKALKAQVAALNKKVKSVQSEADGEGAVILHCMLHSVFGVKQNSNYAVGNPVTGTTTALDLAPTGATNLIAGFNSDPACMDFVGQLGLRHAAATFTRHP
jgi:outer membrane murein-binding lipoprotein Lpp